MMYLAQPYNHPKESVRERRYRAAMKAIAEYTKLGFFVFSPIVHYHETAKIYGLPKDFQFWRQMNFEQILLSKEVWVLPLEGYEDSIGLASELEFAKDHNRPITWLTNLAKEIEG